ncbi:unnamed protein product [Prunus brigantina]
MKMVSSLFKTLFLLGLIALIAFAVQSAQVGADAKLRKLSHLPSPPPPPKGAGPIHQLPPP